GLHLEILSAHCILLRVGEWNIEGETSGISTESRALSACELLTRRSQISHRSSPQEMIVNLQVIARHPRHTESLLEDAPAFLAAQISDPLDGTHGLVHIIDDEPGDAVVNHLLNGPAAAGNDRSPAGQGFNHDQPERLRPVDRKEQGGGSTEQLILGPAVD